MIPAFLPSILPSFFDNKPYSRNKRKNYPRLPPSCHPTQTRICKPRVQTDTYTPPWQTHHQWTPLSPPGMRETHLIFFCCVRCWDWSDLGYWRYIVILLDTYAGLIINYTKGRVSRLGEVALVPWCICCFRVGSIWRYIFFLELVYFEEITDGLILRSYFSSP